MPHDHWSDRFPYLVPVWHSLSGRTLPVNSQNSIDPNLDIDFGGIGMYNEISQRHYRPLLFKTNRPMLPFYIKPIRNSGRCNHAARNCLAFSNTQNILFSCHQGQIRGINVSIDEKRFQVEVSDVDCHYWHQFNERRRTERNPFCFSTEHIWHLQDEQVPADDSQHILELRLDESVSGDLELWSHSRRSLKMYKYYSENVIQGDQSSSLRLSSDFNASSTSLFPSETSLLNNWDRNDDITEEFLASFIGYNSIYRWNAEANVCSIERTLKSDQPGNVNNIIGVHWAKALNPFLYYYGTHGEILMGDIRENINGSQQASQLIVNARTFCHFKDTIELFQTFIPNPTQPHQIITSSDFSINFLDIRYPGKNIFQCKHMLTKNLVNKLYTKEIRCNDRKKMLLVASNSERSCLLTFDTTTCIQPIMEHCPFYLNMPRETAFLLPAINSDKSFITGTEILPGRHHLNGNDDTTFISVALLSNNGDIYVQDFWPSTEKPGQDFIPNSTSFMAGEQMLTGQHSNFLTEPDDVTKCYLEAISKYIRRKNAPKRRNSEEATAKSTKSSQQKESSGNDQDFCLNSPLLKVVDSSDNTEELYGNLESISFGASKISGSFKLRKYVGRRNLNLDMFRRNWTSLPHNSSAGLRDSCHPLTATICDKWFKIIDSQLEPNQTQLD